MTPETKARLLASMEAGRLVIVCGAGLSIAPPSRLPSAREVAEACFDKHVVTADPDCDPALRSNLEGLAEHFRALGTFEPVFLNSLVPWRRFYAPPNAGHAAIADFLVTRAAVAGLSANFDILIEQCGWAFGFQFRAALDGDEAARDQTIQSPLVKFHGCHQKDVASTIWTRSQLGDAPVSARINSTKTWLAANLRNKDLLVVGFWSDWDYLNAVIGQALVGVDPISVTVVDMASAEDLEEKAPDLWELAHGEGVHFTHVQESGAEVLAELRHAFSVNFVRQLLAAGRPAFEQAVGSATDPAWLAVDPALDNDALYNWRRDAEGVPVGEAATLKNPGHAEALGAFHLLLRRAGAEQLAHGYRLAGRTVRVVSGAHAVLSSLRAKFVEAPAVTTSVDVVVAVGATSLGVPGHIIREGRVGDVIRSAPAGLWLDSSQGRQELNI